MSALESLRFDGQMRAGDPTHQILSHSRLTRVLSRGTPWTVYKLQKKNPVVHSLPPINMLTMVKSFSKSVLAETLPNPTLVKHVNVKYNAVR